MHIEFDKTGWELGSDRESKPKLNVKPDILSFSLFYLQASYVLPLGFILKPLERMLCIFLYEVVVVT